MPLSLEENREVRKGSIFFKRRGRATVIGEKVLQMPLGNQEGAGILKIRKSGDLPVMAVIYPRVRGNARRMGFLYKKPSLLG